MLRPGRFDRIVRVQLPDLEGRLEILKVHTKNKPLAPDVNLNEIARETFGFSGAQLESLANEAAILARRSGSDLVCQRHLQEAIEKVILGEKLPRRLCQADKRRVAIHESGHAIVSEVLRPGSVSSVTIAPRSAALGYVRQSPQDEQFVQSYTQMLDEICTLVAGGVAEQEETGERSTGVSEDFQRAAEIARRAVLSGASPLGFADSNTISSEVLNRAITGIAQEQMERAKRIIQEKRYAMNALVERLLEKETVTAADVQECLKACVGTGGDSGSLPAQPQTTAAPATAAGTARSSRRPKGNSSMVRRPASPGACGAVLPGMCKSRCMPSKDTGALLFPVNGTH